MNCKIRICLPNHAKYEFLNFLKDTRKNIVRKNNTYLLKYINSDWLIV